MLKTSEVAKKLRITNSQVQDMVDYGYLPVADTYRCRSGGIGYLFAENQLESIDVAEVLAEIREIKTRDKARTKVSAWEWKKRQVVARRHDRFIGMIADLPDFHLLKACYYLFHLNHYAKAYPEKRDELYPLKSQVLERIVNRFSDQVRCMYLIGKDNVRVWLCEDCCSTARSNGYSYREYVEHHGYCSKCKVQVLEREYYSLVEFIIESDNYRFCFHLPLSIAKKWLTGIEGFARADRGLGEQRDEMYFYGRKITRVEERIVPLPVVVRELRDFLEFGDELK